MAAAPEHSPTASRDCAIGLDVGQIGREVLLFLGPQRLKLLGDFERRFQLGNVFDQPRFVRQRHDSLAFIPLVNRLKIVRRGPGRPRTRPGRLLADKAYSSSAIRPHLRRRRITATIPEPADQARNRLRRGCKGG
jgi:hypothetical protein